MLKGITVEGRNLESTTAAEAGQATRSLQVAFLGGQHQTQAKKAIAKGSEQADVSKKARVPPPSPGDLGHRGSSLGKERKRVGRRTAARGKQMGLPSQRWPLPPASPPSWRQQPWLSP